MRKKNSILCCLVIYLVAEVSSSCVGDELTKTVCTANGRVRGHRSYTFFGKKEFYTFKGIPYAEPPVNVLRFKPPQRPQSWNGILDAVSFGSQCIQLGGIGKEDCLYLNVYTTNVAPNCKLPVLIMIHGGAFVMGSPDDYGPDFLFDQADFVMVSMNYRLGPFGFLTLGTPEFSGNMGLKDQQLAMKWVVENIHNFGGDANQVTVYGISSGAYSLHHHIISKSSSKLFQRAILASGSSLNPRAVTVENHFERSKQFAAQNGLYTNDRNQIITFLQNADASLFFAEGSAMVDTTQGLTLEVTPWSPVVEPCGSIDSILLRSPSDVLRDGFTTEIDTLFGLASEESLFSINSIMHNSSLLTYINEEWNLPFPIYSINQNFDFSSERFAQIGASARYFYFGHQEIDVSTIHTYAKLVSDLSFNYGVDVSVRTHAKSTNSNTYYYRFSVDGVLNIMKQLTLAGAFGFPGATHTDDIFYVFRLPYPEMEDVYSLLHENSMERQTIDKITKAYASFIVTGKPTPEYLPVQTKCLNFVDYTNYGVVRGVNPFGLSMEFWDYILYQQQLF